MRPELYEICIGNSKIYIDISTLILVEYRPIDDTLKLGFKGGLAYEVNNGKKLMNKLLNLINIIPLEVEQPI